MNIDIELRIASWYVTKANQCKHDGKAFELSLAEFARLVRRKRCYYTGTRMTLGRGAGKPPLGTDLTIDRIDNAHGYTRDNVVACCYAANQLKARVETPNDVVSAQFLKRFVKNMP